VGGSWTHPYNPHNLSLPTLLNPVTFCLVQMKKDFTYYLTCMLLHYAILEGLYRPLHILEGQGSSYALIYMILPNRQSVHDSLCLLHCGPPIRCSVEGQPAHIH